MQIAHRRNMARSLRIPRSFWYSAAFAAAFLILFGVWISAQTGSSQIFTQHVKIGLVLASIASVVLSWVGVRSRPTDAQALRSSRHLFWVLFPFRVALVSHAIGNALYAYNYQRGSFAFPSWADVTILLGWYPAFLAGVMRLFRHSLSGKGRAHIVLDSLLLIVSIITLSWYFTLGPILLSVAEGSLPVLIASLAYPTFDVLLLTCVILFTALHSTTSLRPAIALLITTLVVLIFTDSYASFCVVQEQVYLSAWPNLGWASSIFLLTLTTQAIRWSFAEQTTDDSALQSSFTAIPLWRAFLPYSLVLPVIALIIYVWGMHSGEVLTLGTYICGGGLLVVIFLKQVFSIQETNRLNRRLQQTHQELEGAYTRIARQALTDALTGLPNHRAVMDQFSKELDWARQHSCPLSLLFFDIDCFKQVNDTHGHSVGDAVLRQIGTRAAEVLRERDTLGRFGGEEFVVLLPETDTYKACGVAERIRSTVAASPIVSVGVEKGISMTVSIGVATYLENADTPEALLCEADKAMYLSKRLGRNQICMAEGARHASEGNERRPGRDGPIFAQT